MIIKKTANMKSIVSVFVTAFMAAGAANAANSASIVSGSLVQGNVKSSMSGNSYALETNKLDDWCLDTGGWGGKTVAVSFTNANFNGSSWGGTADTMVAFGNGGSVTLKLDSAIHGVDGEKEIVIFTAQAINAYSGSLFNGNMEASVLLSSDGNNWFTLDGVSVAQNYTGSSSRLNAPTLGYDFGTLDTAWKYGTPGTTQSNLDALSIADYTTPMIDDNLFNGTGTSADRKSMETNNSSLDYDAIFGTSGGGNWFDISYCGLSSVEYIRLNAVNCSANMGIRLDALFTTGASVLPEPATMVLLGMGIFLAAGKRRS